MKTTKSPAAAGRPAVTIEIDSPLGDSSTPLPMSTDSPSPSASAPRRARMVVAGTSVELRERDDVMSVVCQHLSMPDVPLALGSVNLDHIHHFGGIEKSRTHLNTDRTDLEWFLCADGMPIVERGNRLTGYRWPRITGADLLPEILRMAEKNGHSVGFLGGTHETHRMLRVELDSQFPGLTVSGWWAPDRSTIEDGPSSRHLATQIAASHVDVLVVCLGKPLQELWIERFGNVTGATVLLAFGAASDFLAGRSKRAPKWLGDLGLEWAYRLMHEPKRLAHRYLVEGPEAWIRMRGAFLVADSGQSSAHSQRNERGTV